MSAPPGAPRPLDPYRLELGGPQIVEASAGTGKTYTIGTLMLRLLLEDGPNGRPPPGISEILVVTFTVAATAELRQRVRERLADALLQLETGARSDKDPAFGDWLEARAGQQRQACAERLRRALRDFDEAAVFTIHGFCQRVLRQYAFESGGDFSAELMPDESTLLRTVVHDFWARLTYDAPPLAVHWLQADGKLGLPQLESLGTKMARAPRLPRVPARAAAMALDRDGLWRLEETWREAWLAAADAWRAGGPAALELLAAAAEAGDLSRVSYKPDKVRERWPERWAARFDPRTGPPLAVEGKELAHVAAGSMAVNKGGAEPRHPFFDACARWLSVWREAGEAVAPWAADVPHQLDDWLRRELPARKRQAGRQSFDDLVHRLRDALASGDDRSRRLTRRVRSRYRAALIDEFQDTDQVQWDIFRLVFAPGLDAAPAAAAPADAADPVPPPAAPEPPLLLVGDPKQAIYGFRGADVFAYLEALEQLGPERRHTLLENFRSDSSLVAAVNAVWGPVPRPFLFQQIPYVEVAARHGDRVLPPRPPLTLAYVPLQSVRGAAAGKALAVEQARRAAARAAATAVRRLLAEPPLLERGSEEPQPVTAADVAVLVRANREAERMQRVLRAHGVPSVLYSEASVLDQAEAAELVAVMAAMLDPADAGRVRAALAAPALGLGATELDALSRDEVAWEERVESFRRWQGVWRRWGLLPAVRQLLDEEEATARLLTLVDGERRLTNLLHLTELLHGVAFQAGLGPEGLAAWFQRVLADTRLREQALGDTAQLRLESDAGAVTVVTVHKAKGLEYPFVFCPFAWSSCSGATPPCRLHDLDGDRRPRLHIGPDLDPAARNHAASESLAEELRLLYVAMTRARHGLWLACGPFNGCEASALAYVLHAAALGGAPAGESGAELAAWQAAVAAAAKAAVAGAVAADAADADPLWQSVRHLAAARPALIHAVRLGPADLQARGRAPAVAPPAADARARTLSRRPRQTLSRSSFTALARGGPAAAAADPYDGLDRDGVADGAAAEEAAPPGRGAQRVPLADVAGGVRLGTGVHALLERIDFGDPAGWPERARALARVRALPEEALAPLLAALEGVVRTPLGHGELAFTLAEVPRRDRIDEMAYVLPVSLRVEDGRFRPRRAPQPPGAGEGAPAAAGVSTADLARALAAHPGGAMPADYPPRLRALGTPAVAGWLGGALDLVFRRAGPGEERWYLLDWKSNRLGPTWDDYAPARLTAEMARHHYFLQAHLYAVALHRYLGLRLTGYAYERHFGGVLYAFLRGMRPDSPGSGVLFDRPPRARLEALDALLREGAP